MTVKKLYVVGSGAMGSGIAQTAATHGIQVVMNDINEEFVAKGYNKIKKSLEKAVTKGRMTEEAKEEALANLTTTVSLEDAKDADFVIEAASENKEIKLGIFKQLDKICKPEAILASNTSSLPITEIAAATERPDQVIGTHFFNIRNCFCNLCIFLAVCNFMCVYMLGSAGMAALSLYKRRREKN